MILSEKVGFTEAIFLADQFRYKRLRVNHAYRAFDCVGRQTRAQKNLFRRFRGGEFLEARIIPQRIEHRIEPEQGGSERQVSCN